MDKSDVLEGDEGTFEALTFFFTQIGSRAKIAKASLLRGGANNQVVKIDCTDGNTFVMKRYFYHEKDPRPRLDAEYTFLNYAWNQGIRTIPQPIQKDVHRRIGFYSYIDGRSSTFLDANQAYVAAAADFVSNLNRTRFHETDFMKASEACFQPQDFLIAVETRIRRLILWEKQETHLGLRSFLQHELIPAWDRAKAQCDLKKIDCLPGDFILSPSDFGLHNTLFKEDNQPIFIDFEYAGLDDPAKTICDFFLQPKFSISMSYFDVFSEQVASLSLNPEKTLKRTRSVFFLSQIKWCCIMLNVFLKVGQERRHFSRNEIAQNQEKQLDLTREYLRKWNA